MLWLENAHEQQQEKQQADAIAAIEAVGEGQGSWAQASEDVLKLFAEFPEELKGDKTVCQKALAKLAGLCGKVIDLFAMFADPVRKDLDVQNQMIDTLMVPIHSSSQGPFLAKILDGSKDDAATVHRCCGTWKKLWQVSDVLKNLPNALKADPEFQKQFVIDVDLGRDALQVLENPAFAHQMNDISFCKVLVEKCLAEARGGGMGQTYTDGDYLPKLYRQFSDHVRRDTGVQKLVFEKCSKFGIPMLFQAWPHELQKDPLVRDQFLNKCHDEKRVHLFWAFCGALFGDVPLQDQRRFVETTDEKYLHKVFAELPEASKNNVDLVYACLDNPTLASDSRLQYLFDAFPNGVKSSPQVQQRCLDKCSSEAFRDQLRSKFPSV